MIKQELGRVVVRFSRQLRVAGLKAISLFEGRPFKNFKSIHKCLLPKDYLRFYITGAGVSYDNVQTQEAGDGNHCYFYPENAGSIAANGSQPKLQIEHVGGMSYTRCNEPPSNTPDIQPEQDGNAMGWVDVTYKTYEYESRP